MIDRPFRQQAARFWSSSAAGWAVVGLGAVLRLRQYLSGRSLWFDEILLSLNIVRRSFAGLLEPLEYDQGAPPLFLLGEKLISNVLGTGELALRLLPLLGGIASLVLLHVLARRILPAPAATLAVLFLAVAPTGIYFSADVKQYSTDATVGLLLLLAAEWVRRSNASTRSVMAIAVLGAVSLFMSHPAAFLLAGIGGAFFWAVVKNADRRWLRLLPAVAVWGIAGITDYFWFLKHLASNKVLTDYHASSFAPIPNSVGDLQWYLYQPLGVLQYPGGLVLEGLAAFLLVIGIVAIYKRSQITALMLVLPAAATLVASALHLYPFTGRLVLFLVPSIAVVVAQGVGSLFDLLSTRKWIALFAGVLILVHPTVSSAFDFIQPVTVEESKPVLQHVKDNRQEGEVIYANLASRPAMDFYGKSYGFEKGTFDTGPSPDSLESFQDAVAESFQGRRVWMIFVHPIEVKGINEHDLFLVFMDAAGCTDLGDGIRQTMALADHFDCSRMTFD